jgi:Ca-activated chloride channel family protein
MVISYRTLFSRSILVILLLVWLGSNSAQNKKPLGSKTTEPSVNLVVTVTDRDGKVITGLPQSAFAINIDSLPTDITSFSNQNSPMSVGILFDVSTSALGGQKSLEEINKNSSIILSALARFVELSNKANDYFVIGFNKRPALLLDWTSDQSAVVKSLNDLVLRGDTALYDACYLGVEKLQHGRYPKRALILISDGQDNNSSYTYKDVLELVRETGVLIYCVKLEANADLNLGATTAAAGEQTLRELADTSGGQAFYKKGGIPLRPSDAEPTFETIANELNNQYVIGIAPGASTNEKWKKVKVRVRSLSDSDKDTKDVKARTREGFYSR